YVVLTQSAPAFTYALSLHDALPIYFLRRLRLGHISLWSLGEPRGLRLGLVSRNRFGLGIGLGFMANRWRLHRVGASATAGSGRRDRKSTRLNSSHVKISYAVFCLKK